MDEKERRETKASGPAVERVGGDEAVGEMFLAILLTSLRPNRVVALFVVGFLLVAVARGIALAWGKSGLEGRCGCLGPLLPMRVRQQLVVSGGMLLVAGALLIVGGNEQALSDR